jgi:integrase
MKTGKILTDSVVKAAKARDKPYKLSDSGRLYLLVTTAGAKYWKWNYRLDDKDSTYTLGEYPDVGLHKARELRDAAKKLVAEGIHPLDHKKEVLRKRKLETATTLWGITEEWIAFRKPAWSPYYATQVETYMGRYVRDGEIGSRPIRKVTSSDIVTLVRSIATRAKKGDAERKGSGAPTIAINIRQWCSAVFRFAIVSGKLDVDPTASIQLKDVVTRPKVKNNKALKPDEIRTLLSAVSQYRGGRSVCIAIELLLLTFVRTGELRKATWDEFSLDTSIWTIPAARMKVKDAGDHVVPLSKQVVLLLRELKENQGHYLRKPTQDWLFPNTRRPDDCMSATTVNRALERMGLNGKDSMGFAAHGFRGTASTLLNEQGFRHKVIEFQLAHKEKNKVASAYNKAEYLEERISMMQRWSDYIDTLRPAVNTQLAA